MLDEVGYGVEALLLRIVAAAVLGGLIGLERDVHGRAAGLRTHLLVSVGSAVFMVLSELISLMHVDLGPEAMTGRVVADPGRIAAQVITGIGFLGAGVIIKEGFAIRGLTTAACLWVVAAVGMACGSGFYLIALATTMLALIALVFLKGVERLYPRDSYRMLTLVTTNEVDIGRLSAAVRTDAVHVLSTEFERNYDNGTMTATLSLRFFHKGITDQLLQDITRSLEATDIPLKRLKWKH